MKCRRCEYPLWDLTARVCPECGLGFSPVDYTFVINSVRFMCPHCRQDYYGTGEGGHLVPRRFNCVKCGTLVDEAEMVLLPTRGVSEVQTLGGVVPWRERKRNVVWRLFGTVGQSAFAPHRLARFCGEEVRAGEAWVFGGIAVALFALTGVGWCGGLIFATQSTRLGMQGSGQDFVQLAWSGAQWTVLPLAVTLAVAAAWALCAHAVVRVGNRRPAPLGKTLEVFGYALGAAFVSGLPIIGLFMLPLAVSWIAVSAIIQMKVRHGISAGRATLAGLILPGLAVAGYIVWLVLLVMVSNMRG